MHPKDLKSPPPPATFRPTTDFVAAHGDTLRSSLRQILRGGASAVLIDFTSVAMVDSVGIGLLIATQNSLAGRDGGRLAITNASRDVLELLTAMRLDRHFTITGTDCSGP